MNQGVCTFPGLESNRGAEMDFCRGVTPSTCRIFLPAGQPIVPTVGTLKFIDDDNVIEFKDAAIAPGSLRTQNVGRDGFLWSVAVRDRRWKWRYPVVSGEYNVRRLDGSIVPSTKRSIRDLIGICCDALGEPGAQIDAPGNVYPYVKWYNISAAHELARLCDIVGRGVVLGLDNIVRIVHLGPGANLPNNPLAINATYQYRHSTLPSRVDAMANRDVWQMRLPLRAVGLDVDGRIEPIDDLSYTPEDGWGSQWYTVFDGVETDEAYLAMNTVFRWYQVDLSNGIHVNGESITDLSQIELLTTSVQSAGEYGYLPPLLEGLAFWERGDFSQLSINVVYTDEFQVVPDKWLVQLEYPAVTIVGGELRAAELYLTTGMYLKKPDGSYRASRVGANVAAATHTTEPRVAVARYLTRSHIIDSVLANGSVADNSASADAELSAIANALAATYPAQPAADVSYAGFVPMNLDGAITEIRWRCGNSRPHITRIGRHCEFSMSEPGHQDRRRREKLAQITEML